MASGWMAVARENQAASCWLAERYPRSCLSRSYFAAYAACSGWLESRGVPPGEARDGTPRDNYPHEAVARLLRQEMMWDECRWPRDLANQLIDAVCRLRLARTDADYYPDTEATALVMDALRDMAFVLDALADDLAC